MKIDFSVNCTNPGVVFAIKKALEAAGFTVENAGIFLPTGEPDLQCTPPADYMEAVPEPLLEHIETPEGPKH